ncbi:hypothetical protein [Demequina sp.]|uniref:hypothetical protein n=1 Tax=Demequina sp. TaxID=2050685 RepID=UPI003D10DF56
MSVPRAAASEGDNTQVVDVISIYNFTVSDGYAGRIDANATFATNWASGYPANLGPITFTYWVEVTGTTNFTSPMFTVVATGNPAQPPVQAFVLNSVAPGTYSATLHVTATAYDSTTDITYVAAEKTTPSTPATFTVT